MKSFPALRPHVVTLEGEVIAPNGNMSWKPWWLGMFLTVSQIVVNGIEWVIEWDLYNGCNISRSYMIYTG